MHIMSKLIFASIITISIAIGITISIIPNLVEDYSEPKYWGIFMFLGAMVSFFPPIITIFLNLHSHRVKVDEAIKGDLNSGCIGSIELAMPLIIADLLKAKSIRNTFVGLRPLSEKNQAKVITSYQRWLKGKDNRSWEDIVSISEFFSNRFTSINVKLDTDRKHVVFVLREGVNPINFLILRDEESPEFDVVYFGWLPHQEWSNMRIFRSTQRDLIDFFSSYFDILVSQTWNFQLNEHHPSRGGFSLDYSSPPDKRLCVDISDLIDKKGQWITVSYSCEGGFTGEVQSIAFVEIDFLGSSVNIWSRVFDKDGRELPSFTSTSRSSFYKNNVFIDYKLDNNYGRGVCHYRFWRHDFLGEVITGVFSDTITNRRHSVMGFKAKFNKSELAKEGNGRVLDGLEQYKKRVEGLSKLDLKNLLDWL